MTTYLFTHRDTTIVTVFERVKRKLIVFKHTERVHFSIGILFTEGLFSPTCAKRLLWTFSDILILQNALQGTPDKWNQDNLKNNCTFDFCTVLVGNFDLPPVIPLLFLRWAWLFYGNDIYFFPALQQVHPWMQRQWAGQLLPYLCPTHFWYNLSLCQLLLVLSQPSNESGFHFFLRKLREMKTLSHHIFTHADKIPASLLFTRLRNHSSLSFSFCVRCSNASTIFPALPWTLSSMTMSFLCCRTQNQTKQSRHHPGWVPSRAHCWPISNFFSLSTPRTFPAMLLSRSSGPSIYWCMGLFLLRGSTWHYLRWNFMKFLRVCFSSMWGPSEWQYSPQELATTLVLLYSVWRWALSHHPCH